MNVIVIGWVNVAMVSIIQVFFDIPKETAFWYMMAVMVITMIYASLSGLIGVAITDTIQFAIAITGCIILAVIVVNSDEVGGIDGLKEKLPEGALNFFPTIGDSPKGTFNTLSISVGAFLSYIGVQWWSSWYPGAEPGGGGYIAQRMMSAKDEKNAVFATLFFQAAHYCLRPWPWILVGLCSLVLYPELGESDKKLGFVMAMKDFLPPGLKGLLFVAFLAAYMSTISTQLNWGASYLVNDLYKRFIEKKNKLTEEEQNKKNILVSRLFTVAIMIFGGFVTTQIDSISAVWTFVMSCGAGLGLVLILRWYWWRINAWSEITATIAPFIAYYISSQFLEDKFGQGFLDNNGTFFVTVGFTTIAWLIATVLTKPSEKEHLIKFYQLVKPEGLWNPIRIAAREEKRTSQLLLLTACWISAISFVYSLLFATGKTIFKEWNEALIWGAICLVSIWLLQHFMKRTNIMN
jgi:Na+/proline symporter